MVMYRFRILSLFLLIACNNGAKQSPEADVIKRLIGKELIFTDNLLPETIEKKTPFSFELFRKKPLKIVAIINLDCGLCIESLNGWEEYLKNKDITFILIVGGNDFEFFKALKNNESQIFENIFHDKNNIFEMTNKIPRETRFKTFLIDKDNKILLIGNPLFNKNIDKLYEKEISNLATKQ